jgi:hypothetical protein
VQVYRTLSQSPNRTIVMLPTMPEGTGLPQVLTEGKRKNLTPADEKLLDDMEARYMKVARQAPPVDNPSAPPSAPTSPPASAPPAASTPSPAPQPASASTPPTP